MLTCQWARPVPHWQRATGQTLCDTLASSEAVMYVCVCFLLTLRWVTPSSRRCTAQHWRATTRRAHGVSRWRSHPPPPGSPEMLSPPSRSGDTAGRDTVRFIHGGGSNSRCRGAMGVQKTHIFFVNVLQSQTFLRGNKLELFDWRINPHQRREQEVWISSLFTHPPISCPAVTVYIRHVVIISP